MYIKENRKEINEEFLSISTFLHVNPFRIEQKRGSVNGLGFSPLYGPWIQLHCLGSISSISIWYMDQRSCPNGINVFSVLSSVFFFFCCCCNNGTHTTYSAKVQSINDLIYGFKHVIIVSTKLVGW